MFTLANGGIPFRFTFVVISNASVLLVEDEENDALLMQRAFQRVDVTCPLKHVLDGVEARDYLSGKGSFSDRTKFPIPSIVLLDLKMPRMSGFELLEWVRKQEAISHLLVIVLTSSKQRQDIARAYELGANAYVAKPGNLDGLLDLVRRIRDFWLTCNLWPAVESGTPGSPKFSAN